MNEPACPHCGGATERLTDTPVGPVLQCLSCGRAAPAPSKAPAVVQHKLGLEPGRAQTTVTEPEEPIMNRIRRTLELHGYTVLCTVHRYRRHKCSKCGFSEWPRGGYGADAGVPDLLVWSAARNAWTGLETKGTRTRISDAQKILADAGKIVIVRSEAEALAAMEEMDGGRQ